MATFHKFLTIILWQDTAEHFTQNEIVLAKATCSHTSQSDDELSLAENDIVEVTNRPSPGWWEGILNGKKGRFPSHCVVLLPEDKEGEELKQKGYESPAELLDHPLAKTEAIVKKNGATVTIPGTKVVLNIPSDALPEHMEQCLIKMRIIPRIVFQDPEIMFSSNSSVVVEILPNKLLLRHPAQLMIPHCLVLKENETPTAKVFMSHHKKGCSSSWEEHSGLEYRVESTCSVVWLNSFCWVTIKIDDKEVLAKKLILYTWGKNLMPTDDHAEIAVGYYPDLEGEAKFLSLNKSAGVVTRTPFTFMKEGCHPLCWSLEKFPSKHWNLYFPEENNTEIAFKDISASVENQCTFVLEKTSANARNPMCIFKASQDEGQQPVTLAICPEQSQHFSSHPPVGHFPLESYPQAPMALQDDGMNSTFRFLSRQLGNGWLAVGRELEVSDADLDHVKKENFVTQDAIYAMLLCWKQRKGSRATYANLITSLEKAGRKDLAEKLLNREDISR